MLISCTWSIALFFSNKTATNVHVVHLEAFWDLGQSKGYAWGAAALVHMYDQLDEASRTTTRQDWGVPYFITGKFCVRNMLHWIMM